MEFVLVLLPSLMIFNLLFTAAIGAWLRASTFALAANLAQVCGLADFDPNQLSAVAQSQRAPWLRLVSADCARDQNWAAVDLRMSLKPPLDQIEAEVVWHAASESRR